MHNLTDKQQRLYEFYTDKGNWKLHPPTLAKCRTHMGVVADNSIMKMLDAIRHKGYPLTPK